MFVHLFCLISLSSSPKLRNAPLISSWMSFHLCNKAHASQVRLCFFFFVVFFFLYTSYAEHGIHFCTNKREFSLRDQTGGETRERRKPHAGKHAPTDTLKSEKALATRRRHISLHLCKQGACWDCFGKRESHLTEKKNLSLPLCDFPLHSFMILE